jgi:hypothetical protein
MNIKIRRVGHMTEIAGLGTGVNSHRKRYDKPLKALIDRCKELQTDLVYSNFADSGRICKVDEVLLEGIPT